MNKPARKTKYGFTLLELMVAFAIVFMVTALLAGGAIYLKDSISLDNSIRELKSQIQSVQNSARNSFIASNTITNQLSTQKITVGWALTLTNDSVNQKVDITKRSVYFFPASTGTGVPYDFSKLSDDIFNLKQALENATSGFSCDTAGNFLINGNQANNFGFMNGVNNQNGNTFRLQCSVDGNKDDYFSSTSGSQNQNTTPFLGMRMTNPASGLTSCLRSALNVNIFYTLTYGEVGLNPTNADGCQIQFTSAGFLNNTRAIKIDKKTGGVITCGNFCQ